MVAIYRVTQDFHKPQYFLYKYDTLIFVEDKPLANIDIVYRPTMEEAERLVESTEEW